MAAGVVGALGLNSFIRAKSSWMSLKISILIQIRITNKMDIKIGDKVDIVATIAEYYERV